MLDQKRQRKHEHKYRYIWTHRCPYGCNNVGLTWPPGKLPEDCGQQCTAVGSGTFCFQTEVNTFHFHHSVCSQLDFYFCICIFVFLYLYCNFWILVFVLFCIIYFVFEIAKKTHQHYEAMTSQLSSGSSYLSIPILKLVWSPPQAYQSLVNESL